MEELIISRENKQWKKEWKRPTLKVLSLSKTNYGEGPVGDDDSPGVAGS